MTDTTRDFIPEPVDRTTAIRDYGLPPQAIADLANTPPKVQYVRHTKVESLDDLDQEAADEPFHFELRGQQFSMISPKDADWVTITAATENPRLLVHVLMPDDDRLRFLQLENVRLRVLQGLMERYQKHFGLPSPGESGGSAQS